MEPEAKESIESDLIDKIETEIANDNLIIVNNIRSIEKLEGKIKASIEQEKIKVKEIEEMDAKILALKQAIGSKKKSIEKKTS